MKRICILVIGVFLASCASQTIRPADFEQGIVKTKHLSFLTWERVKEKEKPLRIYLEDSGTPEPKKQIALKLAMKDPSTGVIYLARPCQYIHSSQCTPDVWKKGRFNPEIVQEMKEAMIQLIKTYRAPYVELVGYGDGAAMALLLASRVRGVRRVVSIGGVLDTSELDLDEHALNPAKEVERLTLLPQLYFVGDKDNVAPYAKTKAFTRLIPNAVSTTIKTVSNTHHTDWEQVEFEKYY